MATERRNTGISVVGDLPWGTHFCHFYETKQDLFDTLVPFFKAGLEGKEFCLWVVSDSDLITVEEARGALAQAVPDLDRHLAEVNIEILKRHDWYFEKNVLNLERVTSAWDAKLKQALTRGYAGMRASADTFWLAEQDWKDFFDYEKQVNDWITDQSMTVLCTYPLAKSGASEVLDVVQAHQFAIARRQGKWEVIETPELVQAKAEIKRLNEELEQRVVERTSELAVTNTELRREISERERAEALLHAKEQEFRAIVENAPDQIIRYDRIFRRTYVNPAVASAYGLPAEALIGKPIGSALQDAGLNVNEGELAQIRQRIAAVFDTGRSYDYEITWLLPTGLKYYSVRLFPELDLNGSVVNVLGISRDITELKKAEEKLKATSEQLRALSASLSSAREQEGTRIARELHDELGSALTSLKWDLESIDKFCSEGGNQTDASKLREKIKGMREVIEATLNAVLRIASELRPTILDDLGLLEAIEWQAQQFKARTGIVCQVDSFVENVDLSREQATAIFRILQEALTNALRHAHATRVTITIAEEEGECAFEIRDNGRGITDDEKTGSRSLGLIGMRERAHLVGGRIEIAGVAQRGTVLTLRVPIHRQDSY